MGCLRRLPNEEKSSKWFQCTTSPWRTDSYWLLKGEEKDQSLWYEPRSPLSHHMYGTSRWTPTALRRPAEGIEQHAHRQTDRQTDSTGILYFSCNEAQTDSCPPVGFFSNWNGTEPKNLAPKTQNTEVKSTIPEPANPVGAKTRNTRNDSVKITKTCK